MLFSVIVPVYNCQCYLEQAIISVLNQTYRSFELLLVDDGSSDLSGQICDMFAEKDKRVKVFHKENGGVSSARNVGLENATGEWICFLDSDDWLEDKYLETMSSMLDVDIPIIGFNEVDSTGNILRECLFRNCEYDSIDRLIGLLESHKVADVGYIWHRAFKHAILEKNQIFFDESLSFSEDTCFFLEYLLHSETSTTNSYIGYNYRRHSGSLTMSWPSQTQVTSDTISDVRIKTVTKLIELVGCLLPKVEDSSEIKVLAWNIMHGFVISKSVIDYTLYEEMQSFLLKYIELYGLSPLNEGLITMRLLSRFYKLRSRLFYNIVRGLLLLRRVEAKIRYVF